MRRCEQVKSQIQKQQLKVPKSKKRQPGPFASRVSPLLVRKFRVTHLACCSFVSLRRRAILLMHLCEHNVHTYIRTHIHSPRPTCQSDSREVHFGKEGQLNKRIWLGERMGKVTLFNFGNFHLVTPPTRYSMCRMSVVVSFYNS